MTKVTGFNKMNLGEMRKLINEKFAEIEKETGVKIEMKSISFNDASFKSRIEAVISAKSGDKSREDWNRQCYRYGLKPEHLGMMITVRGTRMRMIRIDSRKYKMPIICDGLDGRQYKVPSQVAVASVK